MDEEMHSILFPRCTSVCTYRNLENHDFLLPLLTLTKLTSTIYASQCPLSNSVIPLVSTHFNLSSFARWLGEFFFRVDLFDLLHCAQVTPAVMSIYRSKFTTARLCIGEGPLHDSNAVG